MSVFNKESVQTAGMQAVQEKGWYYVGPKNTMWNRKTGECCLVGEILRKQGCDLNKLNHNGLSAGMELLKKQCGENLAEAEVQAALATIMAAQDRGIPWGDVMEMVA